MRSLRHSPARLRLLRRHPPRHGGTAITAAITTAAAAAAAIIGFGAGALLGAAAANANAGYYYGPGYYDYGYAPAPAYEAAPVYVQPAPGNCWHSTDSDRGFGYYGRCY